MTLSPFGFERMPPPAPAPPRELPQAPDPVSFRTAPSPAPSAVFSNADGENDEFWSDDTSMISTQPDGSQDPFPTQDYREVFEDEDFTRSFSDACLPSGPADVTDLFEKNPFKRQAMLPSDLRFWYCWELHRYAAVLGLVPLALHQELKNRSNGAEISFEEFWPSIRQISLEKGIKNLPPRSKLPKWTSTEDRYEDESSNKVIYFTASLDWEEDPSKCLFQFRLNETHLEQSCRFHRKLGADRFLVISAPALSNYPDQVKALDNDKKKPLHEKITEFLASNTHWIAGRNWRVCYVEAEKPKSRRQKNKHRRVKIIMFAESGHGIIPLAIKLKDFDLKLNRFYPKFGVEDLIQWHMSIDANLGSTDLKLFSRMGLGFSKTTPTVELEPHEFLYRHDPLNGPVMDDGCALMSYPLAKAIWGAYGGEGEVPSAVQGRISGAKGLWIVDYQARFGGCSQRDYWIEIADSQLKIHPHPRDRNEADAVQRTFEVLKFWGDCKEGHFNTQLVTILEDRGIPWDLFRQALETDLKSFVDSLSNALADPVALRLWMQEHGYSSRSATRLQCSFPIGQSDQMKLLLEAGYHPEDCEKLVANATTLLNDYTSDYLDKMKIRIPHSTVVFCAPDPSGVLAEDEVFLGFSKPIIDPKTGISESALDSMDVLLARNPAYLASDMQRRRAVYKHELRNYKNVVLFSTKGQISTASLLSGGDFDGDTVTCIWDPRFVEHFQNVDLPPIPNQQVCGLIDKSRPLSDVFTVSRPVADAMTDYLRGCVVFNWRPNLLGTCSKEYEKLVYSFSQQQRNDKLSDRGTVMLGALAGYLVDSNKQGWVLTDKAWHSVRRKASGIQQLPDPGYKGESAPRRPLGTGMYLNVIDFLKFDVAGTLRDRILSEFAGRRQAVGTYDRSLTQYWRDEESKIAAEEEQMRKRNLSSNAYAFGKQQCPYRADVLKGPLGLQSQIKKVLELWTELVGRNALSSPGGEFTDSTKFYAAVQEVFERYDAIEPIKVDHYLRQQYEEEVGRHYPFPYWSLLKASCLYARVSRPGRPLPSWVWYIAGRELCILKTLQSFDNVTLMRSSMHNLLRVDTKHTKRLLENTVVEEVLVQDEDEAVSDDDDDDTVALE